MADFEDTLTLLVLHTSLGLPPMCAGSSSAGDSTRLPSPDVAAGDEAVHPGERSASDFAWDELDEYRDHVWRSGERLFFDFDAIEMDPAEVMLTQASELLETAVLRSGRGAVASSALPTTAESCSLVSKTLDEVAGSVTPPRSPTPSTRTASSGSSSLDDSGNSSLLDCEETKIGEHARSLAVDQVPFDNFVEHHVRLDAEEVFEDGIFDQQVDLQNFGQINIRELPLADGVHASTGCQLWPASVALGRLLLSRPWLVKGKSVMELGAGCGFAGVVAAKLASKVLVTDADCETVANLHHNLTRNRKFWHQADDLCTAKEVSSATLDWRDLLRHGWPSSRRVDVVIGSDIIYGNWGPMVAEVAEKVLLPGGQLVMVSAEDRGGLPEFCRAMLDYGYSVDLSHWEDNGKRFLLYICGPTSPPARDRST